ncbi:AMP-binding protein [Streptomyces umbrinus]
MNQTSGSALHSHFLRGLEISPEGTAIRCEDRSLTYTELHRTALRWAGALKGPRSGPVGVLAANSTGAYAAILAVLYSGAPVVPLRPDWPAARTRQILDSAGVDTVLADERGLAALPGLVGDGRPFQVFAPEGHERAELPVRSLDSAEPLAVPRAADAADTAYVLFTSGSTGRPKGVPITHGNATHYFGELARRYDFTERDVFSQTFDLNFDCAMFDMFCAWGSGAVLQRIPPHAYRDLPAFIAEQGLTVWFSTPSAIGLARRTGTLAAGSMPTLRWSFFAGEALSCQDAADWHRAAAGSALENLYGPTELTVTVARHRWSPETSPGLGANGGLPIGAVHDGHDWLLLAEGGGTSAVEGELCVSGPQMTPGYLDPQDDHGRFLEHEGRRYYRTGDRVRRTAEGCLAYLGRLDTQVQVQGLRVELAEVDGALRACAGVDEAATVAVTGGSTGATELVAFYTGAAVAPVELARQLREMLPQATIPRHFRHLPELPRNANRKIDRLALTARARRLLPATSLV